MVFIRPGLLLGWHYFRYRMVGVMKQLFEVQVGRFSFYVVADTVEQADQNVDGILEGLYNGDGIMVTGSTLEKTVDSTDEAVAVMLRDSGGLH